MLAERGQAKRKGIRIALADVPLDYDADETWSRDGMRPYGRVHLDHTTVDLWMILGIGAKRKRYLARVTLTLAVCAFSHAILGYFLSFDKPSYASVMGVMRDVVRRHGVLPAMLVLDNAREFWGHAMRDFCGAYGIAARYRPKGQPKYGGPVETLFKTTNALFVHNLIGNSKALRNPRSMSREVDPRVHAVWRFGAFDAALREFLFDAYNATSNFTGKESPNECLERGLRETGRRVHVRTRCDSRFLTLTLPFYRRHPVVNAKTGIVVAGLHYHARALQRVVGQKVSVKIDLDNVGRVFAWVAQEWVECRGSYYSSLTPLSVRESRLLSAQLAGGASRGGRTGARDASVASLMRDAAAYEQIQLQRMRDEERSAKSTSLHTLVDRAAAVGGDSVPVQPAEAASCEVFSPGEDDQYEYGYEYDDDDVWNVPTLEELEA